jgi:hypothetical protein
MKAHGVVLVIAITAAVAALWPAAGGAATLRGVVVARQHGTLLVASPAGVLTAVRGQASIGFRLAGTRVVGTAKRATIRGVVVRRLGRTLILSSNHHLIAVPNRVGRALAGTTPAPVPGTVVSTGVSIANGEIEQEDEDDIGRVDASSIAVQATISAVGAGTVTLNRPPARRADAARVARRSDGDDRPLAHRRQRRRPGRRRRRQRPRRP